jgi:hypothetical protein
MKTGYAALEIVIKTFAARAVFGVSEMRAHIGTALI